MLFVLKYYCNFMTFNINLPKPNIMKNSNLIFVNPLNNSILEGGWVKGWPLCRLSLLC